MLEQLDRSRLIGVLFVLATYWTLVLSSEFIRRTWMTVPGSEALIMCFLAFLSSLAWLAFLMAFLPRTIALFLIVLAALASSAANVFCFEYDSTVSAETLAFISGMNGAVALEMASGIAIFWITLSFLPVLLWTFMIPESWSFETRLYLFGIGVVATLIACGLCLTVIPELAWRIDEWDRLWELFTPTNLIKASVTG